MLILGEPLPGDESVLPAPDEIGGEGGYATVAATVQHCNTVVESIPVPINEASEAGPEYDQLEAWQLSFLAEAEKLSS